MTTYTPNAIKAFENFGLQFSYERDAVFAAECGSDYLETTEDITDYQILLALFLSGQIGVNITTLGKDGETWEASTIKL